MDKIKESLEFDPLAHGEKAFGNKDWGEFSIEESSASLGLAILHNESKAKLLKESHDTHFGMSWEEFEEIVTSNGFKIGYEEKFPYENHEEKAVMFYREDGLLIWATSFCNMRSVNGGNLIGEIRLNDVNDRMNIPRCSNGFHDFDNNKLNFSKDIREGLIWFINQMNQYGEFVPQWEEKNKFLWFLNFGVDKKNINNYREISKKKMKLFSDEAKKIVQKYLN